LHGSSPLPGGLRDFFGLQIQKAINFNLSSFFLDCKARELSDSTLQYYREKILPFIKFLHSISINDFTDIDPNSIRIFLLYLSKEGHNPGGVHAYYRAIKAFVNWCEKEYEPENWKNPFEKIKAPKVPVVPLEPVNIKDVEKMLYVCKENTFLGSRDYAILLILLDTGLRASEFLSIKLNDIEFRERKILIRNGKGGKFRYVFFGNQSNSAINRYLRIRKDDIDYLWISVRGTPLLYGGLRSLIMRMAKKAGVSSPSIHSFRRYFALTMLRNEVDVFSIQKLMGHSDLTILHRYLKQTTWDIQRAHKKSGPVDQIGFLKKPPNTSCGGK
jgi:integrase/recombinase XerD